MNDFTPPQLRTQIMFVTKNSFVQRHLVGFSAADRDVLCENLLNRTKHDTCEQA